MESLAPTFNLNSSANSIQNPTTYSKSDINLLVIQESLGQQETDSQQVAISDLSKSLNIKAQKIVEKLNELLKAKLPNGLQELKPEEITPEATADRIVSQVTSLFDAYAKQNPNQNKEELLTNFLTAAKKGVQQGYDDAFEILKGLGAFDFEGVQAGVEQTKILIEQKLAAFEDFKRQELGLVKREDIQQIQQVTKNEFLQQAGVKLDIAA